MSLKTLAAIGIAAMAIGITVLLASSGDEEYATVDPIDETPGVEYWQEDASARAADEELAETPRPDDPEPLGRQEPEEPSPPEVAQEDDAEPAPSRAWRVQDAERAIEPPPDSVVGSDELVEPERGADEAPAPEDIDEPGEDAYEPEEPELDPDTGTAAEVEPSDQYEDEQPAEPEEDETVDEPLPDDDPGQWE